MGINSPRRIRRGHTFGVLGIVWTRCKQPFNPRHISACFVLVLCFLLQPSSRAQKLTSILDARPEIGYFVNHSPLVFGLPGTVTGGLGTRTQLSGDWGGSRSEMAKGGVLIDVYSTTDYQSITSGGLSDTDAFTQSTDLEVNLDTGRLGWWPNGLFHIGIMSRYGSGVKRLKAAGSASPTNTAYLYPETDVASATYPTEYYLAQEFTPQHVLALGKIETVSVADPNVFAGNYRYQFQNLAFNVNPMLGEYLGRVAWLAADAWTASRYFRLYTAIADPNSSAHNFAANAFRDVSLYQQAQYSYSAGGLPGTIRGGWIFSTKEFMSNSNPVNVAAYMAEWTQQEKKVRNSYVLFFNFDQYLGVAEEKAIRQQKLSTGQPLRGWGVFGRLGMGPARSNIIDFFGSVGVGGYGVFKNRPYDRFGFGYYRANISDVLGVDILDAAHDAGLNPQSIADEQGIEIFYNFAVTPAVQITPSFQYIWNPLAASLANTHHTALWGLRLEMAL